ncbi:MAG: VOC family protein [Oscillospiraceae bacterium]
MKFKMVHNNINVVDAEKSKEFYEAALGMKEIRRKNTEKFVLIYLGDGQSDYELELTQVYDHTQEYDLGDNETHLAFRTDDFEAAYAHHSKMGCICYENKQMGIYFIEDLDGYWLEIIPTR